MPSSVSVLTLTANFGLLFNFNGRPYTFTRLCQGYCESPTLYNEALRDSLVPLVLSPGTALLQSHGPVRLIQAFSDLKLALQSSPTLGLPDPTKPFTQAVDERDRLHDLSSSSNSRAPAIASVQWLLLNKALLASRDIVGYAHVTLLVPHAVSLILLEQKTVRTCPQRGPDDGEPHNCLAELQVVCSPRPDLSDTPLTNPDLILQQSQVALTEACKFAAGKTVTIYTDSRYAFGVVHDFGALWKHRNFLKSDGKPILHHSKIIALLDAILLPKAISVCKCVAHTHASDGVSLGNARADAAAKTAAQQPLPDKSTAYCSDVHEE
ncbi:hypothetical protein L3Q82_010512 [Scortum barcoo]|uniref:Uncharacterized protein n=1 Tax=Scortum barcoo TaxID=214431 RepID=A0ACB8WCA5_9TELE|nr:hypothetical protein L3Q82_010512 [Scortum barcoo]